MDYNKNVKKVTIMIAQVEEIEFNKMKTGNEFKMKFITEVKPKPPTLRELVEQLVIDVANIKQELKQLKIDNNLK